MYNSCVWILLRLTVMVVALLIDGCANKGSYNYVPNVLEKDAGFKILPW